MDVLRLAGGGGVALLPLPPLVDAPVRLAIKTLRCCDAELDGFSNLFRGTQLLSCVGLHRKITVVLLIQKYYLILLFTIVQSSVGRRTFGRL